MILRNPYHLIRAFQYPQTLNQLDLIEGNQLLQLHYQICPPVQEMGFYQCNLIFDLMLRIHRLWQYILSC